MSDVIITLAAVCTFYSSEKAFSKKNQNGIAAFKQDIFAALWASVLEEHTVMCS